MPSFPAECTPDSGSSGTCNNNTSFCRRGRSDIYEISATLLQGRNATRASRRSSGFVELSASARPLPVFLKLTNRRMSAAINAHRAPPQLLPDSLFLSFMSATSRQRGAELAPILVRVPLPREPCERKAPCAVRAGACWFSYAPPVLLPCCPLAATVASTTDKIKKRCWSFTRTCSRRHS